MEVQSSILKRQLDKVRLDDGGYDVKSLVSLIDQAYMDAEKERRMANRSLHLMSSELLESNQDLRQQTAELQESQEQLMEASQQLTMAARYAGMAEVATNVLHNIGNILNSVNTTASLLSEKVMTSKMMNLIRIKSMLQEHQDDLVGFLTIDPKGKLLPEYIMKLADFWKENQDYILHELDILNKNIDYIKDCIAMQQTMANTSGMVEFVNPEKVIDAILRLQENSTEKSLITVEKKYDPLPAIILDRIKLHQILVNLFQNAFQALLSSKTKDKKIIISINNLPNNHLQIRIQDNGGGILPENLAKIFGHGFTTKKTGHGFGLHYCANAATEMGGTLEATSPGLDQGATFILTVPYKSGSESSHTHE